jgi:hypothetical protein
VLTKPGQIIDPGTGAVFRLRSIDENPFGRCSVMLVWIDEERKSCEWVELLFGMVSPVRFLYQLSM